MTMMHRLLSYVGKVWNTEAKERQALTIHSHNGQHTRVTIDGNQLHLHTLAYTVDLPIKQSVVLDDLLISELVPIIEGMGYRVTIVQGAQALLADSAMTLLPKRDELLDGGAKVHVYTSNVWRMLYPIARLLEEVEQDVDRAIQEMFLRTSKGKWLDYWASFFTVKRYIGEADGDLVKRIALYLVNPKTNNRSLEELMKLVLGFNIEIYDAEPGVFEGRADADLMSESSGFDIANAKALMRHIKAAGVVFAFNYYKRWAEDFNSHIYDVHGKPLAQLDGGEPLTSIELDIREDRPLQKNIAEILTWLVEYPTEVMQKPSEDHSREAQSVFSEETYAAFRALGEHLEQIEADLAETQYLLTEEQVVWAITSEVAHFEVGMYAKIQEELTQFFISYTESEAQSIPVESSVEVVLNFEDFVPQIEQATDFTLNTSHNNGEDLLFIYPASFRRSTPEEGLRMILTDADGQVIRSLS